MGIIGPQDGARTCELLDYFLIGRSSLSYLRLDHPSVSAQHACPRWTGRGWTLQDLGSRNGTYLNGQRLPPSERVPITQGAEMRLGDDPVGWQLLDDTGPSPSVGRQGVPTTMDSSHPHVSGLGLVFTVSRNEEQVDIVLEWQGQRIEVRPRAHHYMLLTLARLRLSDQAQNPTAEQSHGWIDQQELTRMLALDTQQLNLNVHRARRQFMELKVTGADAIVERRPTSKELRIGVGRLAVHVV